MILVWNLGTAAVCASVKVASAVGCIEFVEQRQRGRRDGGNRETSYHGAGAHGRQSSNSPAYVGAVSTVRFRSRERIVYAPLSMTRATSYGWGSISSANCTN